MFIKDVLNLIDAELEKHLNSITKKDTRVLLSLDKKPIGKAVTYKTRIYSITIIRCNSYTEQVYEVFIYNSKEEHSKFAKLSNIVV